ncbi:MAG: acetyl-CoA carboxylase biotin carboxyl carrier protein subunit [Caldilineaceae bacterium]
MADFYFEVGAQTVHVRIEQTAAGQVVQIGERIYHVQTHALADGQLNLVIGDERCRAFVSAGADGQSKERMVWLDGQMWRLTRVDGRPRWSAESATSRDNVLTAVAPGQVRELLAAPGDSAPAGATLVILEAMKMEMRITAPAAGNGDRSPLQWAMWWNGPAAN